MIEIARYSGCFICGDQNQYGLKVKFFYKEGKAVAECTAQQHFEGYKDIYHGGITASLLDEVMIKALLARHIFAMTVELTVKFHKAVQIGQHLNLEGVVESQKGRLYITRGEMRLDSGEVAASASGKYLEVREDMKGKLLTSLERKS
ncbi:MAG: PaaI family thioesterase [bacterium]|jgi:acyl-coenzyme A thioesterase PaaI-like protein